MAASTLPPSREAFRQAVSAVAAKAHEKLPACNSRIDSAVKLVLLGEVILLPDGTATVGSCSDPNATYTVNGTCTCKDYSHAPGNLCKHRLAYGIMRRAMEMVPLEPSETPLPEAPASVNCHITIAGRQAQITLRDTDEQRLLVRLEAVLAKYPAQQGKDWCKVHNVQMKETTKNGRTWLSHRNADGSWCKGK